MSTAKGPVSAGRLATGLGILALASAASLSVFLVKGNRFGTINDDRLFEAVLEKATHLRAMKPLVFFGTPVFERKHHVGSGGR